MFKAKTLIFFSFILNKVWSKGQYLSALYSFYTDLLLDFQVLDPKKSPGAQIQSLLFFLCPTRFKKLQSNSAIFIFSHFEG